MRIIYRACSVGSEKERPINGKIELVKFCFNSFKKAFEGLDYELIVLLDKPNNDLRNIFKGEQTEESFYSDFNEGNVRSFHRQLDLAGGSDRFMLVEDDYYFVPGSGRKLLCLEFPFFTPYDHPGYYTESTHDYKRNVEYTDGHHWQTVISTTLTFGGQGWALEQEMDTLKKYGWADHPMWCDITQRLPLYSPIPTLATHCETPHLSPRLTIANLLDTQI